MIYVHMIWSKSKITDELINKIGLVTIFLSKSHFENKVWVLFSKRDFFK